MRFIDRLFGKAAPNLSGTSIFIDGLFGTLPQELKAYATEGYAQNPIVFACAAKIAEAAASVKLEVHTLSEKGEKDVALNGPLLKLLAKPNPMQTWEEFSKAMVAWYLIAGEVFIVRLPEKGPTKELHILNPSVMGVEKSTMGNVPKAYVYGSGEAKKRYPVNIVDGTSQILHIKTFNPNDPWRGLSPLSPAARDVDIHNSGAKWNNALLENSARPSGVLEATGTVNETTVDQLRKWFKRSFQGGANAGEIPLLTGGVKFTPLSLNPKDMDFQNSMSAAAKNMGLVYGVPLPLLTMEAATFSNMDAAQERLWTDTVLPLLNVMIGKLSDFLTPLFYHGKENISLEYNADSVPALEAKRERMFTRMKNAVGGGLLTPNEARAEMGYDALDGGDVLYVPGSLKPMGAEEGKDADELVKAMKAAGFTAQEVADCLALDFGGKKAA
ncbi:phage portal protein [Agrobacterium pusense]|uniref:phage portal protein n=1 Tax=Agrobacterium pusense TaxID=648995 RepID=UPI00289DF324|nr:phage portal protein [Agrobacterium pusense]